MLNIPMYVVNRSIMIHWDLDKADIQTSANERIKQIKNCWDLLGYSWVSLYQAA